jgi:hypothetical protein
MIQWIVDLLLSNIDMFVLMLLYWTVVYGLFLLACSMLDILFPCKRPEYRCDIQAKFEFRNIRTK